MYGYIYETTCLVNNKKYIGMHKWDKDTIDKNYLGSGIYLKRAIKKYGKEKFTIRILEWCETRDDLCEREKYWISQVQAPINEGYFNINDGGFGGHGEYYVQQTTEKQLEALDKGRHLPASNKLKESLSLYRKTVVVSEYTREKLRQNQIGRKIINNGKEHKYVYKKDLEYFLSNGWVLGRIKK